jgi:hypothetical protein
MNKKISRFIFIGIVLTEIEYDGTLEKILKKYKAEKIKKRNPIPQDF